MDIATFIFVAVLGFAAFLLTVTVRRDFQARERQRREHELQSRHPRRKP
jgi:hypothetical protein